MSDKIDFAKRLFVAGIPSYLIMAIGLSLLIFTGDKFYYMIIFLGIVTLPLGFFGVMVLDNQKKVEEDKIL